LPDLLDAARGDLLPPIRAEVYGPDRLARQGRTLAMRHRARRGGVWSSTFFPRLRSNIDMLRLAQRHIAAPTHEGENISPAGEWLLDNFHLIDAQLLQIHEGLPRRYFRSLPVLREEPLAGLPRIYGVAWDFVAHTDGAFDEDLLVQFLRAYQARRELQLAEMWALPTTLRVVLVENLRRLAEREAAFKAARDLANATGDRIETLTPPDLDALLVPLRLRGVARTFLCQLAQRLQGRPRLTDDGSPDRWLAMAGTRTSRRRHRPGAAGRRPDRRQPERQQRRHVVAGHRRGRMDRHHRPHQRAGAPDAGFAHLRRRGRRHAQPDLARTGTPGPAQPSK
jgi:cyclic beta-1,2-glucan synthetase